MFAWQRAGSGTALRVLRQLVMERHGGAGLRAGCVAGVVTRAPSPSWAEVALDRTIRQARAMLDEAHGPALVAPAQPGQPPSVAQLWIIGMGKLGARELITSSDIDLIYVYDHDGETGQRPGPPPHQQPRILCQAVRHVYQLLWARPARHGFHLVDLALRPTGNSGPAAVSLALVIFPGAGP